MATRLKRTFQFRSLCRKSQLCSQLLDSFPFFGVELIEESFLAQIE